MDCLGQLLCWTTQQSWGELEVWGARRDASEASEACSSAEAALPPVQRMAGMSGGGQLHLPGHAGLQSFTLPLLFLTASLHGGHSGAEQALWIHRNV